MLTHNNYLLLHEGRPSSTLSLTQDLMKVEWNPVDVANNYTVSVSPVLESGSVFFTSNTTIQLPFLYNQDYNVSVMANNCAGSSISSNINVRIGNIILKLNFCVKVYLLSPIHFGLLYKHAVISLLL